MVWFVCGLIAGFICGMWYYDGYLEKHHSDLHEELAARIMEKLGKDK